MQQVPDRLDIGVVERVISLVEIDPEAHTLSHLLPVTDVAHDGFAAALGEFSYTNFLFDLLLIEDTKFFLNLMLHWKAVRIPTGLTRYVIALHGFVAREDVFEAARQDVVNTRFAIGGRRAFVKAELRSALGLIQRFLKNIMLTPELQHLGFEGRTVVSTLHFFK